MDNILVSVCMITYRHEKYIAEAIEGILMQECEFDYELIIADDASPDGTEIIVNQFIETHKQGFRINYTKHNSNLGMVPNFLWAMGQCKGRYIALCEGDDFWVDKFKLQKQVRILEKNPSYSFCYHKVHIKNETLRPMMYEIYAEQVDEVSTVHIINSHFIPTLSLIFRNYNDILTLMTQMGFVFGADRPLELILSLKGRGKLLYEEMGVYRLSGSGVSSSNNYGLIELNVFELKLLSKFNTLTKNKYRTAVKLKSTKVYSELVKRKIRQRHNRISIFIDLIRDMIKDGYVISFFKSLKLICSLKLKIY